MPPTLQALAALLVLLPGFLAAYVVQVLCVRRKQTELDKIIEALIFSFLIYLASVGFIGGTLPFAWHIQTGNDCSNSFALSANWIKLVAVLFCLPVAFGAAASFLINSDILEWLRKVKLTSRTTRSSTWNEVWEQKSLSGAVQVELSDGRNVMGWVVFYSDDPEEASIFLEDAAWVTPGTYELDYIPGPGYS
jgi:hypothetical protein